MGDNTTTSADMIIMGSIPSEITAIAASAVSLSTLYSAKREQGYPDLDNLCLDLWKKGVENPKRAARNPGRRTRTNKNYAK
jgi:hypothetical protein